MLAWHLIAAGASGIDCGDRRFPGAIQEHTSFLRSLWEGVRAQHGLHCHV